MRTIADLYVRFERDMVPLDAGREQRQETKRAFYAGVLALLVLEMQIAEDNLSDEAGAAILEGIGQECVAFKDAVLEGTA